MTTFFQFTGKVVIHGKILKKTCLAQTSMAQMWNRSIFNPSEKSGLTQQALFFPQKQNFLPAFKFGILYFTSFAYIFNYKDIFVNIFQYKYIYLWHCKYFTKERVKHQMRHIKGTKIRTFWLWILTFMHNGGCPNL